jgi:AsmA family protein
VVRVLKWLGIVLGVLVLLIVGAFAMLETSWAREFVAKRASAALGREVRIDENFDIDWSLRPKIRAGGIHLANTDWAGGGDMADIGAVEVTLDLPRLISGTVAIPELTLIDPKLKLARDAQGTGNWDFPNLKGDPPQEGDGSPNLPEIGHIEVRGGKVDYRDDGLNIQVASTVNTERNAQGEDRVRMIADGNYADEPFHLDATTGTFLALRDQQTPFPVHAEASVGSTRTVIEGSLTNPQELVGMDIGVDIKGQDLSDLFPIIGFPAPSTPPFGVSGRLERHGKVWSFTDAQGRVGDSDIGGNIRMDLGQERAKVTGNLSSRNLEYTDLAGFVGAPPPVDKGETRSPEQEKQARKLEAEGRVIPDTPINVEMLKKVDVEMRYHADRLLVPHVPAGAMDARIIVNDGRARVEPVRMNVAGGKAGGIIQIDAQEKPPAIEMDLEMRALDLAKFFKGTRFAEDMGGTFGGKLRLKGNGDTVRSMLGSSNGQMSVIMEGGKVSNLIIEVLGIDVAQALGFALTKDEPVAVRCVVADLSIKDGLMKSNALVFDNADSNVTGDATANLKNEQFKVEMLAHPKDFSPLSARTPVGAQGTFADPHIAVDPTQAIARGAAAVALGVFLTPLAAIIPLLDPGEGKDSPCNELLNNAAKRK